jgi:hypothetical protein
VFVPQVRVPEKSALSTTKFSRVMVTLATPRGGIVISFLKKHPGAVVGAVPGWMRTQSVLPGRVLNSGLFPDGVTMPKTGEVMATDPPPPPVLITGSGVGVEAACAWAAINTANAANTAMRNGFIRSSLPMTEAWQRATAPPSDKRARESMDDAS